MRPENVSTGFLEVLSELDDKAEGLDVHAEAQR